MHSFNSIDLRNNLNVLKLGAEHQFDLLDITTSLDLWHNKVIESVLGRDLLNIDLVVELEDWQLLDARTWNLEHSIGLNLTCVTDLDSEACACNISYSGLNLAVITDHDQVVVTHHWWQVKVVDL